MRSLPALLLPLLMFAPACHTLSPEEQQQLASFQRNASLYFEGGKYEQALGLVERGLRVDPDDYKLRSIEASAYLRLSGPTAGEDQRTLDRARELFASLYDERSPSRHDRHVLFYYALTRQKQGLRLLAAAAQVDAKAADAEAQQRRLRDETHEELAAARAMLEELLRRGEIPRLCHYHLLQLAALENDSAAILTHGKLYLEASTTEQQRTVDDLERTTVYAYEQERKAALQALRGEEVEVRTLMAQQLFAQRDYAGALPHVDAVLKIDPTRSDDHYNRGLILRALGRVDEARTDMRTFLATTKLPPDNPKVTDAVRSLTQ